MRHGLTFIIILICATMSFAHKTDSVGTKVKDGKVYILHKIEAGDGLYKLSRKYNVPLKDLVSENPGSDKVIKIGQLLWIPTQTKPVLKEPVVEEYFEKPDSKSDQPVKKEETTKEVTTFAKHHTVALGETMYSISKKYNTSVDMIMAINNLKEPALSVGQKLLVHDGKAETKVVDKELEELKKELDINEYKELGFDTAVETAQQTSSSGYTIKMEKLVEYNVTKIEEQGTGEVGNEKLQGNKNFALHFNAPIGTVIMITNPDNKKTVFVKVVGNFFKSESSAMILQMSERSASQIDFKNNGKLELSYAR